jgi:hypothetical protein
MSLFGTQSALYSGASKASAAKTSYVTGMRRTPVSLKRYRDNGKIKLGP